MSLHTGDETCYDELYVIMVMDDPENAENKYFKIPNRWYRNRKNLGRPALRLLLQEKQRYFAGETSSHKMLEIS